METKPAGEHKDREFSARHVDLFLRTSKKLKFHDVHGELYDRELVLNGCWGNAEFSFVIPTYFPNQFGHNGGEITHLTKQHWNVSYQET